MGTKQDQLQLELLSEIVDLLRRIERNLRPVRPPAVRFKYEKFKITTDGKQKVEGDMNLLLAEHAEIDITGIEDEAGNAAQIEGDKVLWTVAGDQGLGDLQVAEDTKSAKFVRNGKVGTCTVEFRGDADLGPDEELIVGSVELACLGGKAVRFTVEAKAVANS